MTLKRNMVVFMVLAVVLAYFVAKSVSLFIEKPVRKKPLVVVSRERLGEGEALAPEELKLTEWSGEKLPAGSFGNVKALVGRVAARSIDAGEPILESMLVAAEYVAESGMSGKVPVGYRALTLRVDEVSGLSGNVAPGDLVDVIASSTLAQDRTQRIARLLFESVRVHSVAEKSPGEVRAVTLILDPEEAKALAASESANLRIVARSREPGTNRAGRDVLFSAMTGPRSLPQLGRSREELDRFYDERVEPGMRAVTIAVTDLDGVCGFLRQGNRVDVVGVHVFTPSLGGEGRDLPGQKVEVAEEQTYARVVLQNMEILAVADDAESENGPNPNTAGQGGVVRDSGERPCEGAACPDAATDSGELSNIGAGLTPTSVKLVTFLATPVQAEKLVLLSMSSKARLIVRSYADGEAPETKGGASRDTVYGPDQERYLYVTVFKRRERKTERFSAEDYRSPSESEAGLAE